MSTIYVKSQTPLTFLERCGRMFTISSKDIGKVVEAPATIRATKLFEYLLSSGQIEVVEKPEEPAEEPKKKPGKKKK